MILVDTSVMIAYIRTGEPTLRALFALHDAAICGVTRAEVLQGVRNPVNRPRMILALDAFRQISIPDGAWDAVGDLFALLRAAGLPTPWADVVIASLAVQLDVELWARDQHYVAIQRLLPQLRLFAEPP